MSIYSTVVINLGSQCNAKCNHCCFSCNPYDNTKMNDEQIKFIVQDAIDNKDVRTISFTGGEIFLYKKIFIELLVMIKKSNKKVTIISNGIWGKSLKSAEDFLKILDEYNVDSVTLSHDEFHAEYVPTKYIQNILLVARNFRKIKIVLNMAVTPTKMSNSIIKELGDSILGIRLTKFPLMKVGAARTLNTEEFFNLKSISDTEGLFCPGYEVVYHYDGGIYPCCSPAVFETALNLRETLNQKFELSIKKLNSNLLLYIIRKEGLNFFVDIVKNNPSIFSISFPEKFTSSCEICNILFRDKETITKFIPFMKDYYENQMLSL